MALSLYAGTAAFVCYFSMYAYRKPFTAGTFEGQTSWGMDLKAALVLAQVVGYALSKFMGIKFISEMGPRGRALAICILVAAAQGALGLLWLLEGDWKIVAIFLNGIPLGMIWGLVFSFLEGRRLTEVLAAILSASFVVASGFMKSVGTLLVQRVGLADDQMPFVAGLIFAPVLVGAVWMLQQIPPPTAEDVAQRVRRVPMDAGQRWRLFRSLAPGLILLTLTYVMLTAYRDLRDNFMPELWAELGVTVSPMLFTWTEGAVALGVLVIMGTLIRIRNNSRALLINHGLILAGLAILAVGSLAFQHGVISGSVWMVSLGFGLYMAYVPFNCILFDRLVAAFRATGNAGFLIYLADSFGYLGSVSMLVVKNSVGNQAGWLGYFQDATWLLVALGVPMTIGALLYFRSRLGGRRSPGSNLGRSLAGEGYHVAQEAA